MIRLLNVVGARPQIIKSAAISRAIKATQSDNIEEIILHTGQHYDKNMSQVFFDEMQIPEPQYNLGIGSMSHGKQTARMTEAIEEILERESIDGLLLYGDTNSTLAGAVAAAKIHKPIFHIEAGLRSYNMAMPEEQNRIVCDHLSSICFAPTKTALRHLHEEGLDRGEAHFANGKGRQVIESGDIMYDNSLYYAPLSEKKSHILETMHLERGAFVLATIHRPANTDDSERLSAIFEALYEIGHTNRLPVVLPLHPRTAKLMESKLGEALYERVQKSEYMKIVPPAGYFDIIALERNAQIVMTDSGGVQKETFFYERPCVILRAETEWTEIVEEGAGLLADADKGRIIECYQLLTGNKIVFPPLFGDGHAAEKILRHIVDYLQ